MSRTYRTQMMDIDCGCDADIESHYNKTFEESITFYKRRGIIPWKECDCSGTKIDYFTRHNYKRDRKPWYSPAKWYKVQTQRINRAKIEDAMKRAKKTLGYDGYENLPRFRNTNRWDWN